MIKHKTAQKLNRIYQKGFFHITVRGMVNISRMCCQSFKQSYIVGTHQNCAGETILSHIQTMHHHVDLLNIIP